MTLKQKVYEQYCRKVEENIQLFNNILEELRETAKNETKSSVGDKYETARSMLHIEQERVTKQLNEAREQKIAIEKIDTSVDSASVTKGSLVKTNKGYLFFSLALGKIFIDGISIISFSEESMLGKKIYGLKVGDFAKVNGIEYSIESIE